MKFYVSLAATEATTAEGQPLVRGETLELSPEQRQDLFNTRLIAEGQLIAISKSDHVQGEAQQALRSSTPSSPPPELGVQGDGNPEGGNA